MWKQKIKERTSLENTLVLGIFIGKLDLEISVESIYKINTKLQANKS